MRRSSYAGTPSPAKDYHKGMRKKIKKSNHSKMSNSPNNSGKNSPNQTQIKSFNYNNGKTSSENSNYIPDPEILSYYFLLFLAQKKLVSITQRKYLTRFFREWQHRFTSSVLKNLSNSNRQTRSLNTISKKFLRSQGTQIMTPNYSTNYPPQIQYDTPPKQEEPLHVEKQLKSFENSSFSPKSPSLIATLSPKEENNSDLSSFSIDDVLNFSDNQKYRTGNSIISRKNEIASLLDPISNFVPSDEFDQINEKTSTSPNFLNTHKTNYHLLAETLPDDLFSSDSQIEKPQSQTEIKINQNQDLTKSPIRMDEELMIQAALEDEFVSDHKTKPKKKKRRKIIIVKEYSDSNDDVYEYYSRSPSSFSKGNKSPINQKYTFSDESFSDEKPNLSSTIEITKSELNSNSKSVQTQNLNDSFEENKIHSDLNENNISDEIEIENSFSNENDYHKQYNEDEDKGIYRIVGQNSSDEIDFLIRDTDDNQISTDRKNDDNVDYSEDEF